MSGIRGKAADHVGDPKRGCSCDIPGDGIVESPSQSFNDSRLPSDLLLVLAKKLTVKNRLVFGDYMSQKTTNKNILPVWVLCCNAVMLYRY